jgi:hypothetical protein
MRGRNRRGPNPLARSYESNGPDVKVRGTAQHIADRYLQLARDAQSSGDPVTAESYFQYAEHYLRIIAAAQEQMQAQYGYRPPTENGADEDGEGDDGGDDGFAAPYAGAPQNGGFNGQPRQVPRAPIVNGQPDDPQPPMFSAPRERLDNRNQRPDRDNWNRQNRNDGSRFDNRQDGGRQSANNRPDNNRNDNNRQDNSRQDNSRNDNQRRDNYRRDASGEGAPSEFSGESRQSRGGEGGAERTQSFEPRRFQGQNGGEARDAERPQRERPERTPRPAPQEEQILPSFITAPVRQPVPASETAPNEADEAKEPSPVELAPPAAESPAAAPRRRGRPRRVVEPSPDAENAGAATDDADPVSAK